MEQTIIQQKEVYKGYTIRKVVYPNLKSEMKSVGMGKQNFVWEVINPAGDIFVVALDDSKTNGNRSFNDKANNLGSAKKYVDWVTSVKS